ncbi:MAG TPA: CPBP family intramembrane glutamic endopeptidase [Thermoanaerobaculia bacterium]|nr:CPBP family intramembrane glutamic endopeptidase [Thermoanaerobaculia bacterium]
MPAPFAPSTTRDARGLGLLLGFFVVTLLLAAALAPPVYWWIHGWAAAESGGAAGTEPDGLAGYLAEKGFPRYFDRIRWLVILAGVPWLCRATGLTGRRELGLVGGREAWRVLALWLAAGLAMVAGITAGQLASGSAVPRAPGASAIAEILLLGLLAAALVAFFEELVFRGIVFRLAHRALPAWGSVPAAALIFALVHFLRVPSSAWPAGAPVPWWSGFAVAWRSLTALPQTLDGAVFAGLVLAGAILCLIFLRHGTLLAPIGLHAGWVWGAQLHRRLVEVEAPSAAWGGRALIDGAVPLGLLVLLLVGMVLAFRYSAAGLAGPGGRGR